MNDRHRAVTPVAGDERLRQYVLSPALCLQLLRAGVCYAVNPWGIRYIRGAQLLALGVGILGLLAGAERASSEFSRTTPGRAHLAVVSRVEFSVDGRLVVIRGFYPEAVVVYRTSDLRQVCSLESPPPVEFSICPRNRNIVGFDRLGRMAVWSLPGGERTPLLPDAAGKYRALQHASDGGYWLLDGSGGLSRVESLAALRRNGGEQVLNGVDWVHANPSGPGALILMSDGRLGWYESDRRRFRWTRRTQPGEAAAEIMDRGRWVLVFNQQSDRAVSVLNAESGREELGLTRTLEALGSISLTPGGRAMAAADHIRLAPTWTRRELELEAGAFRPERVEIDPSGRRLAAWSLRDAGVRMFDTSTGRMQGWLGVRALLVTRIIAPVDSPQLLIQSSDVWSRQYLNVFDLRSGGLHAGEGSMNRPRCWPVAAINCAAAVSFDPLSEIRFFSFSDEARPPRLLQAIPNAQLPQRDEAGAGPAEVWGDLSVYGLGGFVAAASSSLRRVWVWNLADGRLIASPRLEQGERVLGVADSSALLTAHVVQESLQLRRILPTPASGTRQQTLPGRVSNPDLVAWAQSSSSVIYCDYTGRLVVVGTPGGVVQSRASLPQGLNAADLQSLVTNGDGSLVGVQQPSGELHVWERSTGKWSLVSNAFNATPLLNGRLLVATPEGEINIHSTASGLGVPIGRLRVAGDMDWVVRARDGRYDGGGVLDSRLGLPRPAGRRTPGLLADLLGTDKHP